MEARRLEVNSLEDEIWHLGSGDTFHTNDDVRAKFSGKNGL